MPDSSLSLTERLTGHPAAAILPENASGDTSSCVAKRVGFSRHQRHSPSGSIVVHTTAQRISSVAIVLGALAVGCLWSQAAHAQGATGTTSWTFTRTAADNIFYGFSSGTTSTWTVPYTGVFHIQAYGAQGGTATQYNFQQPGTIVGTYAGGLGAVIGGSFLLNQGEILTILCGAEGASNGFGSHGQFGAAGGGGTFVVTSSTNPLVVAGGGGGGAHANDDSINASLTTSGNNAYYYKANQQGNGGANGSGGTLGSDSSTYGGAGGGGFFGNGGTHYNGNTLESQGGFSYLNGGNGGNGAPPQPGGGYGGGGQGRNSGSGGGGYSGGGGGFYDPAMTFSNTNAGSGGGGGSYLATSASNALMYVNNPSIANYSSNGMVRIYTVNSDSFTSGTTAEANVDIGADGASDLSVFVSNPGTLLTSSSNVVVGLSTTGNTMVISGGGRVVNAVSGVIGSNAGASNNTVTVSGSGSNWTSSGSLLVGYGGSGNSLVVSAGGAVTAGNTAYSATLGYDAGSSNNSVMVTGSGSTFSNDTAIVGLSGTGNSMVVSAGGRVLTGESGSYIGSGSTSAGNSVQVTGAGSEWSNGSFLFVGELGSGNTLTVSNGGRVTAGGVDVGLSAGNAGNSVVVSSGGSISSASTYIGRSGSGNSVLVTGSGSTWTNSPTWPSSSAPLTIGYSGTDSSLTVADGGVVTATQTTIAEFAGSSGALNIGRFGNSDAAGTLSTPTIAFGAGAGRINFNQANSTTLSSVISGTGAVYQLGSGTTILTGNNTYNGTINVDAGTLLINGNQSAANGVVTVAAGAAIGGGGSIGGTVTVNGILSPGNSPGVLTAASLTLGGSSTSLFEINGLTRGTQYDGVNINAESGLTYGGALSLSFGNGSAFANSTTFDLFNFTGTPSGNFTSVTSTGFYAGTWALASGIWSLDSGGQTLSFTPGTGDLVVAVPEPSTCAMALAGLACGGYTMFRRRKRA
jgi:T5SS/PEP-CTERM-associated repeat protein